jgi:hypothetical protein
MRMFGRGLGEKRRGKRIRRLGGGGWRKVKGDGRVLQPSKILPYFFIYADYLFRFFNGIG